LFNNGYVQRFALSLHFVSLESAQAPIRFSNRDCYVNVAHFLSGDVENEISDRDIDCVWISTNAA